jgi:hypothetical protein
MIAKIYSGLKSDDLLVQKLLDYGISVNSKNNRGMTPLHVHLENWDSNSPRYTINKFLDEHFYERSEMPILKIFRRYGCSDLLDSLPQIFHSVSQGDVKFLHHCIRCSLKICSLYILFRI